MLSPPLHLSYVKTCTVKLTVKMWIEIIAVLNGFWVFFTAYDKPFVLRVKTDAIEGLEEQGNTGFCLEWNQHF